MAEDYTYDAVTDVTTLRRTAQEANQYALCMEDKANELAARNAELRARLDAVPVEAIRRIVFDDKRSFGTIRAEQTVASWLATVDTQSEQPDDTDAPLTLAAIEDGDE